MSKFSRVALTVGILAAACARPPATAPDMDALSEWLMTSETAKAISDAALNQSWLSDESGPGRVADLRAAMVATGIDSVKELDKTLRPAREEMMLLLGALRQRWLGSTRGDLAHWAAVALLVFANDEPDTTQIPDTELWDVDYLAVISELRAIAARGNLESVARPLVINPEPLPEDFAFKPLRWSTHVAARAASPAWPVFDTPEAVAEAGKLRIGSVVEFAEGQVVSADDYVLQVRRPGHARVRVDYVKTMARYRLTESGHLEFDQPMNLALRADQTLTVVAHDAERRRLWVWLGDGNLAAVAADCCHPANDVDTLLWLRLATGPAKGKWMMAPESDFRPASWEEYRVGEIAAGRLRERPHSYPRLGALGTRDTARPVVAGARLTVWRRGLAEGEPVFVVHGSPGLGSAYLRLPLTETLGQDRQLFFYDQRGSGYSEGADDRAMLTVEQMVNDLDLLRQRAELEQIDLLAHGFGGLVALRYVLLYPHRVRRLVLIEPEPGSYGEWAAFLDAVDARRSPADRAEIVRYEETRADHPEWTVSPGMEAAILGLRTRAYTVDPAAADRIDFALTDYVLDNWAVTRDALRADLGGWDLHASLSAMSVPTLIVAGDYGALAGAQRFHDSLENSELVVLPGVGHYPFIEAPEQFARIVLDFLRRSDP